MGTSARKIPAASDFIVDISLTIEKITGVQLGKKQEAMVRSRILKRAIELGLGTIENYADHYYANTEQENKSLVSILTTHHTFFFREFQQFEFFEKDILPILIPKIRSRPDKTIKIWSAACSRGQEAYSLAMFLSVTLSRLAPDIQFSIFGTDIDPDSVAIANNAVYLRNEISEAPLLYLGKHWARGSGEISDYVKAKASLKKYCTFSTLNLFSDQSYYPKEQFDIILCRNVFIYFTPEQIKEIIKKFSNCITPDSYIFLGASETLNGLGLKYKNIGSSVYRQEENISTAKVIPIKASSAEKLAMHNSPKPASSPVELPKEIRVFTIDDSSTIHTLLKQILAKDSRFKVVGSAMNGKEAAEKLKKCIADVITLDIHMPEMTGIEYLKKHYHKDHPPVVMISSVSREDSDLALQALDLGASDYVEKPALANLEERGEEIRNKLKSALLAHTLGNKTNLSMDESFAKSAKISNPNTVAILVVGTMAQRKQWESFYKECGKNPPPVYFFVEGGNSGLSAFAKKLGKLGKVIAWSNEMKPLQSGEIAICDFKTSFTHIAKNSGYKKMAIIAYSGISQKANSSILELSGSPLFVEDIGGKESHSLKEAANDYVPATSFPYLCGKALSD